MKCTGLFLASSGFFCFFKPSSCSHSLSQGLFGHIIFDSSYLCTYEEQLPRATLCLHCSVIHCLNNYFTSGIFFSKNVNSRYLLLQRYCNHFYGKLAVIHSFNVTAYFFAVKICSYPLLLLCFSFSVFQNTSYPETNFLSKQLHF